MDSANLGKKSEERNHRQEKLKRIIDVLAICNQESMVSSLLVSLTIG
jgi:hypothetical protein